MNFEHLELFERWLPVVGYEGCYEVSDWGRVRSVARKWTKGKLLNLQPHKYDRYLQIGLVRNRKVSTFRVHKLVCDAFIGSCPVGKQIDHIDGNRTNNTLPNLRYITQLENRRAAVARRGEWAKNSKPPPAMFGKANPATRLTDQQVVEARRLVLEGMSLRAVGREFGVSSSAIWLIVHGKNHRRVT